MGERNIHMHSIFYRPSRAHSYSVLSRGSQKTLAPGYYLSALRASKTKNYAALGVSPAFGHKRNPAGETPRDSIALSPIYYGKDSASGFGI
jgi:hypothetical protein